MMDQHYPGVSLKGLADSHSCIGSEDINNMKAYSYITGIRPNIRVTHVPTANVDNVVNFSNLIGGTSGFMSAPSVDSSTLFLKGVV
ncbi:hypothetical protein [Paenibacillus sp. QZ-Y1]|uniref:hypothetical protein n=1 Tax=Paenibacillus sp. QZ-Y1 TaxID=3414511 RepID=UPI003F795683